MKKHAIITFALILVICASCSDELSTNPKTVGNMAKQDTTDIIILQPRNPNLPTGKPYKHEETQARSQTSGKIGNSDAFLGYAYKLKEGNFIFGDANNVTNAILNLSALKEYDNTYAEGIRINTTESTSFAYDNFDRYQHKSTVVKKIKSGIFIDLKVFSIGRKRSSTEIFKSFIDEETQTTYGELSRNFVNNKFTLQNSEASCKLFARQFLTRSFIRSLYNSPISSTLSTYGDFVLTGYLTGGKVYAYYCGHSEKKIESSLREKDLAVSMNAAMNFEKTGNDSVRLKINHGSVFADSSTFKANDTFVYIKTFGGESTGDEATVGVRNVKGLNIDLSSWAKSLKDESNHTIIDISDNGLNPLSDFVLEQNFKQRLDDTSNDILPASSKLLVPYINIMRVMVRSTSSYEPLYDVVPVLITRQGDYILLKDKITDSATDKELRQNNDNEVFMRKADSIASVKSQLFSSDIKIVADKRFRLNPRLRSPLCIVLSGFKETNFYRFYYEKTNIEYIYDPSTRICFSYYSDEGDDEVLDIYGIREWAESLPEKRISIASLANSYNIIGL